jgi:hypothetical protein
MRGRKRRNPVKGGVIKYWLWSTAILARKRGRGDRPVKRGRMVLERKLLRRRTPLRGRPAVGVDHSSQSTANLARKRGLLDMWRQPGKPVKGRGARNEKQEKGKVTWTTYDWLHCNFSPGERSIMWTGQGRTSNIREDNLYVETDSFLGLCTAILV